ncbi:MULTISPECIES: CDP-glycerol glycerophosphotransferase family protein [unclassified Frondihabitans]|uniref:CDP-glycerol glycerophosphotransferase family protein n=1 Tax=unclassified Frondihabitans TaxID=2626248 RepID=UPI000F5003DC|nr:MULTISPECIES: CDP-glycerol glycerophosphotransferase family protein [unclassified Frondihabitans]RPE76376.1 CDP-glycerol:poly(glycerophosphate) glycerophosphotransferase [Frondihabitans sp. PhB153]RPF05348.1 CDP-glycerol:poly(glycerophosphate) glycerophosphotransferase [Frondihabitans sp. PhB161]
MPIVRDLGLALGLVKRSVRARRTRKQLAKRDLTLTAPRPGVVRVAVYFADGPVNLYQIRQWYAPLAHLNRTTPVAIVVRSPATMLALLDESPVPVAYARQVADLEAFVESQPIAMTLYVNQNSRNFQMMRYARMWHVFVNHGESDKMYMTTNQFKTYDYAFVAGKAALQRLGAKLWDYDLDRRAILIGRPQADHFAGALPYTPDGRIVVLYAPTWEGDRPAAAYGSIASHSALVPALLATGRHRVVYRPHPRSGVRDPDYRAAHEGIKRLIEEANRKDPAAGHLFDDGPDLGWQLAAADVAITDISAMVYDRLATGRPLLIARPVSPEAEVDEGGYLGSAEWVTADQASDIVRLVDRVLLDSDARERLDFWAEHHFGDTTPGVATRRFESAVALLESRWHEFAAQSPRPEASPSGDASEAGPDDGEDSLRD